MHTRTVLSIDGRDFAVADQQTADGLRAQIERKLHEGGGFVTFGTVDEREVSVLVNAQTRMQLQRFDPESLDDGLDDDVNFTA